MHLIYCLINGSKKIAASHQRFIDALQLHYSRNFQCHYTTATKSCIAFVAQLPENTTHLLVVGGDGTLNEAINGIMQHPNPDFKPIIGILPNGTGNDYYKSANYNGTQHYLSAIASGKYDWSDLVQLKTENETRFFANIADVGFGGHVVLKLQKFRARFGPHFSYGLAIFNSFFGYRRPKVRIESASFTYEGELLLAAFCNGAVFGDGLYIHPSAHINDGNLYLTLLGKVTLLDYLKNLKKVKNGLQITHPEARYICLNESIRLTSLATELTAETDGEFISAHTFQFELLPKAFKILPISSH
ncbi:MAG: hypothetical protein RLZZ301_426 [Bacteroidota bacterium]|jgi:diacylglycerol kinase family enzyme